MAISTPAITAVITVAVLSWLLRLARRPVPALPDGSIELRYGRWMIVLGVVAGVVMPLGLVVVALTAGFRDPQDPYYFGVMVAFFLLAGAWALREGTTRRLIVSDRALVSRTPWSARPTELAWGDIAQIKFSPGSGLVFVSRSGDKIRVSAMMSGVDQLIAAARRHAPANVSRDDLANLEQRRARGAF